MRRRERVQQSKPVRDLALMVARASQAAAGTLTATSQRVAVAEPDAARLQLVAAP